MKPIIKVLFFMLTVVLLSQCEEEIELPAVNTIDINNITSISAVLGGEVTSDGGGAIQGRGIIVTCDDPVSIEYIDLGSGDGSFLTTIYSFLPNTAYNVKAYAHNKKGLSYGEELLFSTIEPMQGTFNDNRDENTYKWIEIGNQIWMAENLNFHADTGCWIYENEAAIAEIYGRLYNWETAKQVCPTGWHLPTDNEWKQLEMFLGMSQEIANTELWRGLDIGSKLKEAGTAYWSFDPATNRSGFSALPAGVMGWRDSTKYFHNKGYTTTFWTSTEQTYNQAWLRGLFIGEEGVNRTYYYKSMGFSVRCVKVK